MAHSYHIIIADDEEGVRQILVRVIARIYPEVIVSAVANGLDALAIYNERGADLLITNNKMPGMTGLELIEVVRRGHQATVPIVMVSADEALQADALERGASAFIVKPFKLVHLSEVLLQLVPLQKAR